MTPDEVIDLMLTETQRLLFHPYRADDSTMQVSEIGLNVDDGLIDRFEATIGEKLSPLSLDMVEVAPGSYKFRRKK